MLQLNEIFSGVHFDVSFEDRVNLFSGVSGEGKTFLFTVLKEYLTETGVSYRHFDSTIADYTEEQLISLCVGRKVIIFDNADLYLTQSLLDFATETADKVIISMKLFLRLKFRPCGTYSVRYTENRLEVNQRRRIDI